MKKLFSKHNMVNLDDFIRVDIMVGLSDGPAYGLTNSFYFYTEEEAQDFVDDFNIPYYDSGENYYHEFAILGKNSQLLYKWGYFRSEKLRLAKKTKFKNLYVNIDHESVTGSFVLVKSKIGNELETLKAFAQRQGLTEEKVVEYYYHEDSIRPSVMGLKDFYN